MNIVYNPTNHPHFRIAMDRYLNKTATIPSPKKVYWGFVLQKENATETQETLRTGRPVVWKQVLYFIYIGPLVNQDNIPTRYGLLYSKHYSTSYSHVKNFITKYTKMSTTKIYPLNFSNNNYTEQYLNSVFKSNPNVPTDTNCTPEHTCSVPQCCSVNIQLVLPNQ